MLCIRIRVLFYCTWKICLGRNSISDFRVLNIYTISPSFFHKWVEILEFSPESIISPWNFYWMMKIKRWVVVQDKRALVRALWQPNTTDIYLLASLSQILTVWVCLSALISYFEVGQRTRGFRHITHLMSLSNGLWTLDTLLVQRNEKKKPNMKNDQNSWKHSYFLSLFVFLNRGESISVSIKHS